jgi:hypothetical protein
MGQSTCQAACWQAREPWIWPLGFADLLTAIRVPARLNGGSPPFVSVHRSAEDASHRFSRGLKRDHLAEWGNASSSEGRAENVVANSTVAPNISFVRTGRGHSFDPGRAKSSTSGLFSFWSKSSRGSLAVASLLHRAIRSLSRLRKDSRMSGSVVCGQCGEPIPGEVTGLESAQREPCPKCGSTSRTYGVEIPPMTTSSSVTVKTTVITYPQKLLTLTRRLIDEGEFAIAVVVAHIACEIATERCLTEAFAAKGIPDLEDSVTDFFSGSSLANDRIRKLYTALTGDEVEKAPFWQKFKESAVRRNKIAHSSVTVTKAEAEASYMAAKDLVAHLKK